MNIKYDFLLRNIVKCNNLCRVGGFRDGGYVIPYSSIINSDYLISGGIGSNARYELDVCDINPNLKVIAYDKSFSKVRIMLRVFYHFFKKRGYKQTLIESLSSIIINQKHIIIKDFITKSNDLYKILNDNKISNKNILVKLDIEGSEYEILESILSVESKITSLSIEFHSLEKNKNLKFLEDFINKTKLQLVFISINETSIVDKIPSIIELSFTSNKYLEDEKQYLQASCFPGKYELEYFSKNEL
jgi:hypothetical protein